MELCMCRWVRWWWSERNLIHIAHPHLIKPTALQCFDTLLRAMWGLSSRWGACSWTCSCRVVAPYIPNTAGGTLRLNLVALWGISMAPRRSLGFIVHIPSLACLCKIGIQSSSSCVVSWYTSCCGLAFGRKLCCYSTHITENAKRDRKQDEASFRGHQGSRRGCIAGKLKVESCGWGKNA